VAPDHGPVGLPDPVEDLSVTHRITVLQPGNDHLVRVVHRHVCRPAPHHRVGLDVTQQLGRPALGEVGDLLRVPGELGLPDGVPEQQREPVGVAACGGEQLSQRLAARLPRDPLLEPSRGAVEHRLVQLPLAGKVAVEQELAHAGRGGDLLHRRRRETALGEGGGGAVEDALRGLLAPGCHLLYPSGFTSKLTLAQINSRVNSLRLIICWSGPRKSPKTSFPRLRRWWTGWTGCRKATWTCSRTKGSTASPGGRISASPRWAGSWKRSPVDASPPRSCGRNTTPRSGPP